jgi:hypothetical protein
MATVFISDVQIVRVGPHSIQEGAFGAFTLWYAVTPRYQAEAAVKAKVPADWIVELTDERLTSEQIARLKIHAGEVGELVNHRS